MSGKIDRTDMGRPPRVDDDKLVAVVEELISAERPICLTSEVAERLPMGGEGTRERLKRVANEENVPIRGLQPGGQGGYVWWVFKPNERK